MLSDCAFRAQLALPGQRELFDYWHEISAGKSIPSRADFDPLRIPHLLPHLGLIDLRDGFDHGQFRLAGTRLRDVYGKEITGLRMSEVFSGDCAGPWHRIHDRVVSEAISAHGVTHGPAEGRDHVVLFWLRLPLSDDGTRVDRILCYDLEWPQGAAPAPSEFTFYRDPNSQIDARQRPLLGQCS